MAIENVSIYVSYDDSTIFYSEEDFLEWFKAKYGDAIVTPPKKYPAALIPSMVCNGMHKVHSITPWYKGNYIYDFES